ncbi:GH39 family glycosyl hydrolase [Georgenia alba]|uniref:Glycosyl hydrolases family 39 N-terminal catalytic domain-containing protein n=1 Tax=Georgenia alba TaxID=2233858 RepID=A0ABW2QCR7_9MICO
MPDSRTSTISIDIDLATKVGTFTPLHGVNNGPICFGGLIDLTPWHRRLNLPSTRLHDAGWPGPVVVDIPSIFPDFSADPHDPASYRFDRTDDYLQSVTPLTGKVVYRLGTSIEWTDRKYETAPPEDYTHWARICIGVIRHLNDGWADGHHFGIRHFEIWNEPDVGEQMWSGTQEQYLELYAVAVRAIKEYDPGLRVGGPVVAHVDGELGPAFVDYVTSNDLPLDFFSWHHYAADPGALVRRARTVRNLLDERGLTQVESYLTEWNWAGEWTTGGASAKAMHLRNRSARGGAFAASSLIMLQDAHVDEAHYFSGDTQWFGLFDEFGIPQKNYFGMLACAQLFSRDVRVSATVEQPEGTNVVAAAGRSDDGTVVVVSSFEGASAPLRLAISGQADDAPVRYHLHWVDDHHDLECTQTVLATGPDVELTTTLPAGTVLMISTVPLS